MAREVFERALNLLRTNQIDGFVDLFAEDGLFELPFAEPGVPQQVHGRENLRRYLDGFIHEMDIQEFPHLLVHETASPDTVIVEFTATGRVVRTGAPYEMRYVVVLTVVDGLITGYRDYWSPIMAARARGGLAGLAATLAEEAGAPAR